jgi:hypothetical protein
MDTINFASQMDRLRRHFGAKYFSEEFEKLAFQEFRSFGIEDFAEVCDKLIGEEQRPPRLPAFRIAGAKIKERVYARRKLRDTREAEQAYGEIINSEKIQAYAKTIRDKILGKISDQEYPSMVKICGGLSNGQ